MTRNLPLRASLMPSLSSGPLPDSQLQTSASHQCMRHQRQVVCWATGPCQQAHGQPCCRSRLSKSLQLLLGHLAAAAQMCTLRRRLVCRDFQVCSRLRVRLQRTAEDSRQRCRACKAALRAWPSREDISVQLER